MTPSAKKPSPSDHPTTSAAINPRKRTLNLTPRLLLNLWSFRALPTGTRTQRLRFQGQPIHWCKVLYKKSLSKTIVLRSDSTITHWNLKINHRSKITEKKQEATIRCTLISGHCKTKSRIWSQSCRKWVTILCWLNRSSRRRDRPSRYSSLRRKHWTTQGQCVLSLDRLRSNLRAKQALWGDELTASLVAGSAIAEQVASRDLPKGVIAF